MSSSVPSMDIDVVTVDDLPDLLPLMRGYLDFYGVDPSDQEVTALAETLIADPQHEGIQLIARDDDGRAVGFATLYWSWSTLRASRISIMNDLFVHPDARGMGLADAIIGECLKRSRDHGATLMEWEAAKNNLRAQKVYD